jgi:hypothetical protein
MHTKELIINGWIARELEDAIRQPNSTLPKDEAIFDEEVVFDDGKRMAIQVVTTTNPGEESCWSQGVLFSQSGQELGCTDVGESLLGEYEVDDYCVVVKISEKMSPLPDYGDHMTLADFIKACQCGAFINYDGHGCYATATEMSQIIIVPSDVKEERINNNFTHVVWFNR